MEKSVEAFYMDKRTDRPRNWCKMCYQEYSKNHIKNNRARYTEYKRQWDARNADKLHNKQLKWKYGIDLKIYKEMLTAQDGCCAICKGQTTKKTFDVDHCHRTGLVRGLLCSNCNRGIGFLKDSPLVLTKASLYLLK